MPQPLVTGTMLQCSFGAAPSVFNALPKPGVPMDLGALPCATIEEIAPIVNIPPFGMCNSMANPTVASATAAALGVLTPMPCVPATAAPWAPPAITTIAGGLPLATVNSKCMCNWGGVISAQPNIVGPPDVT
jgi:hypothetical protein